jgi:hypothetical protein
MEDFNMKKVTMKQKVIDFIKAAGPNGLTFTDIQRYIVQDLKGRNYDEMEGGRYWQTTTSSERVYFRKQRVHRGWWIAPLCRDGGILKKYCTYVNRRYVHIDFTQIKTMKPQPDFSQKPMIDTPRTQISRVRIDSNGEAQANFGGEYVLVEAMAKLEIDLKLKTSECEALRREIKELKEYRESYEKIRDEIFRSGLNLPESFS